jgi:hypothetical protein
MKFEDAMEVLINCENQNQINEIFAEALLNLNDEDWENFQLFVKVQETAILEFAL